MADFNVFWRDKDADKGIVGKFFTAQNMGIVHPSVNALYDQFIVPIDNNRRGFVLKGGTYIKLAIPDGSGGYAQWVFGADADTTIPFAESRLDTGVSFTPGRDYYIYLCYKAPAGDVLLPTADIVVSLNSTFPSGYTADTSRKIGGFHTLCLAVGTISGHPLSGMNAGDILPASFWDLWHRPTCNPEGMVYVSELDFWADIYLQSGSGTTTKSAFGATTTDSQSYSQHIENLFKVGKNPLDDEEFSCAAEGSNQKTNIVGSADPVTTGGHNDTAGRRMISNYGLEERLGWKHKGIERRFVGMRVEEGAKLAGRVSGDSTVAYAWAYSQAAEAIAGVAPPARAYWLRALMLESERIANHLGDLGYLGNDVALSFGLMQFMRLKEDWVRLNAEAFGHRYLMDCIVPGGVSVDLDEKSALDFVSMTEKFEREVRSLKVIYDEHAGLQDRFLTTGRIVPKTARRLGMIGLAGRASGQIWDLRSNHPFKPYDKLSPKVSISRSGDVAGRANVRFAEVFESLSLIRKIIIEMPKGHYRSELKIRPEHKGFGWVEGWRGDILVALETDAEGNIRRCHCHDPSWQNWLAIEHAVIDNIVPDFPLINKSFNLSYSGPDL